MIYQLKNMFKDNKKIAKVVVNYNDKLKLKVFYNSII